MSKSSRFAIRPSQRGHDGLPPLSSAQPPNASQMMIDRIVIAVNGSFERLETDDQAGDLFKKYRDLLTSAVSSTSSHWTSPAQRSDTDFSIKLKSSIHTTITDGYIRARWSRNNVKLHLRLTLNPTRTLRHLIDQLPLGENAETYLKSLSAEQFFTSSDEASASNSLDLNDNYIENYAHLKERLGNDFADTFIAIFDAQLRSWVAATVAPTAIGFDTHENAIGIIATHAVGRMVFAWPKLTVMSAETYFERRYSDAVRLTDRLSRDVLAGHVGARWRRYGLNEVGERRAGSEVIGIDLTKKIQQKYYAKTRSRIRIETTYTGAVRNSLRVVVGDHSSEVFANLCRAIASDAVQRCEWSVFCDLCSEPKTATLQEAANFLATVATEAAALSSNSTEVISALLSTGGIDETDVGGIAPRSLIDALIAAGILRPKGLQRRRQPNAKRRYALSSDWLEVAERMQEAFLPVAK